MPVLPPWRRRTSIFHRSEGRVQSVDATRISLVAAAGLVASQSATFTVLYLFLPEGLAGLTHLMVAAVLFNAFMLWNWGSDPGFVSSSEEPSTARERAIRRWCSVCRLWQPLRTKHCDKCGRCVRKYDHHCYCIGGCVGEFNHLRFVLTLASAVPYFVLLPPALLKCFSLGDITDLDRVISRNIVPFIFVAYTTIQLVLVLSLLGLHCTLLLNNRTTWELSSRGRITYLDSRAANPFNKGIVQNVYFLFRRKPINWYSVLEEDECALV